MATELTFIKEEVPAIVRTGGPGRERIKWEDELSPLTAKEAVGHSFRILTYDKRTAATSRAASIKKGLWENTPELNYLLEVRPTPEDANLFGVYATYVGKRTPAEVQAETDRKAERARTSARQDSAAAQASAPPQTPAQRVKATAKAS